MYNKENKGGEDKAVGGHRQGGAVGGLNKEVKDEEGEEEEISSGSEIDSKQEEEHEESDEEHVMRGRQTTGGMLRIGTVDAQGWGQKRTEIEATVRKYGLDIAVVTKTRSHRHGWSRGGVVDTWESGADRAEGKAVIIPHTAGVTAEALVAHRDYTTMLIKEEGVVVLKIIAVYASPGRAGPDLYQELGREISSSMHPVVVAGDFNKDVIKNRPFREAVAGWGFRAYPQPWTWTWRGQGLRSHERSMIDFVLVQEEIQVSRTQVIGHMLIRTDHMMVTSEVQVSGKQERHPIRVLPRPANIQPKSTEAEHWGSVHEGTPPVVSALGTLRPLASHRMDLEDNGDSV